jgi:phosphatidylinositol N-acetylglucosaminyltransferase subunit C
VGIFQERLSPVSVVGWGSFGTILGWGLWDNWVRKEEEEAAEDNMLPEDGGSSASSDLTSASLFNISAPALNGNGSAKDQGPNKENGSTKDTQGLGLTLSTSNLSSAARRYPHAHSYSASATSLQSVSATSGPSPLTPPPSYPPYPPRYPHSTSPYPSHFSPLTQSRLSTAKSATLIFLVLLGLSPILKSLTKSTSPDSIWAMSCWLMGINLFFFDYGGEYAAASSSNDLNPRVKGKGKGKPGDAAAAKFPASLSTNAALMASTVLASRLRTSTHVFSLTLFSIEVFGLFPVFRRHLRHRSWHGHMLLSVFLVIAAGGGVGVTLAGKGKGGSGVVGSAVVGALVGGGLVAVVMGGCSWWLISLQKYKNVVIGPWDPARPVLKGRGVWD